MRELLVAMAQLFMLEHQKPGHGTTQDQRQDDGDGQPLQVYARGVDFHDHVGEDHRQCDRHERDQPGNAIDAQPRSLRKVAIESDHTVPLHSESDPRQAA